MATTTTHRTTTPPSASPLDQHPPPVADQGRRSGRATAALVLGIISIPTALFPIVAWICGVVAIVLGCIARTDIRRNALRGHGQATAGIVLGAIGTLAGVAIFIAAVSAA
jgi:hypothetical protein